MKSKITYSSIAIVILVTISACSSIKGYLPDKEKDYQFASEIPSLSIPEGLSKQTIRDAAETQTRQAVDHQIPSTKSTVATKETQEAIYIDLVEFSGGTTRIRMEETIERSWRTVGKALSRQSIEITDRNEADKIYFVQYDPDFKKVEDGSLWDEAMFLFGSDPSQEKAFRVSMVENGTLTEIIVLDSDDKPLSKGTGFKLLDLLYKTIKDDLANSN